jgi:hypothetical protein
MPRPPENPFPVVDPDAPRADAGLRMAERLLIGGGCHPDDAKWLAPLLLDTLPNATNGHAGLSDETEGHFGILSLVWELAEHDRNTAFLLLLATLSNCIHIPRIIAATAAEPGLGEVWAMPDKAGERIVAEFLAHGADFNQALSKGWPKHLRDEWDRDKGAGVHDRYQAFFRLLLRTGAVDLCRIINIESLREFGQQGSWHPCGFSMSNVAVQWNDGVSWLDPHSLRVWVWFTGLTALDRFRPAFLAEPEQTLPALAFAVAQAAATWVGRPGHDRHFDALEEAGTEFAMVMRPYFDHIDAIHAKSKPAQLLHEARLVLFRMAWDAESDQCPEPLRKRMVEEVTADLAKLRKVFAAAASEGDTPEARVFAEQMNLFSQSAIVLARYGGVWRCMKSLLLALRSLGTRAVAKDLRYWDEFVHDQPPKPWRAIPATMISLFHFYGGVEQKSDPELKQLRTELSLFLLDKLTDRWNKIERDDAEASGRQRSNEDMKETVPIWRYCVVRAVMDLHIDPEGRGHKALRWSADHDPDPRVRDAARRGHEELRHTRGLPARMSPRRTVLAALWWYRQGHLLGLGIQPDSDGARRTREKELTRTREVERPDNPAAG